MPLEYSGMAGKIADTLNDIIELNQRMVAELDRISTVVGKLGRSPACLAGSYYGSWTARADSVTLITDLSPAHG